MVPVPPNHLFYLIGFGTIIDHPFWGTPIFGNIHMYIQAKMSTDVKNIDVCTGRYLQCAEQQVSLSNLTKYIQILRLPRKMTIQNVREIS